MGESRAAADQAFDRFLLSYEAKYPKATGCLAKDREVLLTFYDFPAPHWKHIQTTNPIESTFSRVKLRTAKTRGCVSRAGMLAMVFKLTKTAEQKWRTLKGYKLLAQVVRGVKFKDGLNRKLTRSLPDVASPPFDKNSGPAGGTSSLKIGRTSGGSTSAA